MLVGEMFLPLEVMMSSFLRPVMRTKPSSSTEPRSPVYSQPSTRLSLGRRLVAVVAREDVGPADQQLAVGCDAYLGVGQRAPDGPDALLVGAC